MKVKRFSASNNYDAMAQIRTELGSEAIILHQKKVKPKGILGFFKKSHIEIVAAVEDVSVNKNTPAETRRIADTYSVKSRTNKTNKANTGMPTLNQIEELKSMLAVVVEKANRDSLPDIIRNRDNPSITNLYNSLLNQDVEEELIEKLLSKFDTASKEIVNAEQEGDIINENLGRLLLDFVSIDNHKTAPKIIFFVGPTGVGKTTTIAKLSAKYSLEGGKSVGLISADTYRIAAVDQLKTYSDILNIPLEIIYNPSEIGESLERLKQNDVIIVDTAGRNHKNARQLAELKKLLDEVSEKEVYLTLSCTSSKNDHKEIINAYDFIENYKIVLTKIDEAATYGSIINIASYTQKQLSYITAGQSVPDDIEIVTIEKIISLLTRGIKYE
ncbi:MAG: flagellar biosynthesis protein FlhF [Clostridiales bacterium]|nr:flagellar biosynthesis protein FlhF [Clostridiales bacterium]